MPLVTLSQANLQVTASTAAATAGALTKIDSSDDESIGVDDMGIDPPDDEEDDEEDDDFVDDNRDLPGDF